jgi:hypothetical protein
MALDTASFSQSKSNLEDPCALGAICAFVSKVLLSEALVRTWREAPVAASIIWLDSFLIRLFALRLDFTSGFSRSGYSVGSTLLGELVALTSLKLIEYLIINHIFAHWFQTRLIK